MVRSPVDGRDVNDLLRWFEGVPPTEAVSVMAAVIEAKLEHLSMLDRLQLTFQVMRAVVVGVEDGVNTG